MKNLRGRWWIIVLGGFLVCFCSREATIEERAAKIHKKLLTIDTHTDTPLRLLRDDFDLGFRHDPRQTNSKVDLPRMIEGGLDAVFFAVFVGQGERNAAGNARAQERALRIFEAINTSVEANAELAELAFSADDAHRIEKSGKRAIYIGMENGYPIGNDLTLLKTYYDLGTRYITLCHTRNNDICDSSTDPAGAEHDGLSPFGEDVIAEMNRLGMIVDVSHISDSAFYDVLRVSKAPVIASHSCARALCDNPRNLDDAMLKELAAQGGVIQMCILSDYVKKIEPDSRRVSALEPLREKFNRFDQMSEEEQQELRREWDRLNREYPRTLATVADVVDHIDHIVKVAGIDHVGIGTDFDGGGAVEGCYDVSEMGNITLELVKRGYNEEQIRKIWSGNFMRVFREVEGIAREAQSGVSTN
jgi:membrane dipeptidase